MSKWKLLRTLTGLGVDPDWSALGLHPNTGVYTVGNADDGVYSFTFDADGEAVVAAFDRQAAETTAAIATALAAAINALVETTLRPYVVSAVAVGSDVRVRYVDHYFKNVERAVHRTALAAPGAGTLTGVPGNHWPIVASLSPNKGGGFVPSVINLMFVQVDANGVQLNDDNVATVFPQIVEAWERGGIVKVGRSLTAVAHSVRVELTAPMNGAEIFTVRLGSPPVVDEATGYVALEVWYRPAVH